MFLRELKQFLDHHDFALYTEHLSFCGDEGHCYDLYPIPFTGEAVKHIASRIRRTQDILERPIALENASYYVQPPRAEMDELSFINEVLSEADCYLHLDVNNIYVNSVNHGYDPAAFLRSLPGERIVYGRITGKFPMSLCSICNRSVSTSAIGRFWPNFCAFRMGRVAVVDCRGRTGNANAAVG